MLKQDLPVPVSLLNKYRFARNLAKYSICKIQNVWWQRKAEDLNTFRKNGDWRNLFLTWKQLSFKKVARSCSVYDKSGSHLITDPSEIRDRWKSHFDEVFNFSTYSFNNSVLSLVPQQPTIESLAIPPTIAEVKEALSRMKCRCAAGKDGISAELLVFGGEDVIIALHSLFLEIWSSEQVPKQWVDSVIVPVPKKGDLHCCDNWRGISLLNVAGKVFTRLIADRISDISESIIDETQCGFRKQRGTVDMVFVARQLQEKAREQNCQLFMCFFDLKKAYDSVPRDALWCLLGKLGFPAKMVNIIKQLHFGMEASVRINGVLSNPFSVSNGLKQGCVLAPFLFNLYFNKVMQDALMEFDDGVQVSYKMDGKLFRRSGTRLPMSVSICDLRFADDVMASCHDGDSLQDFINRFSTAAQDWGLCVSTDKTKVMIQSTSSHPTNESSVFHIQETNLEVVSSFKYLGSILSSDSSLSSEINARIAKAASVFSCLKNTAWENSNLSTKTKLAVYNATVLPALLYGAETWSTTAYNLKRINTFHMACLRQALNVNPFDHISNVSILSRSQSIRASTLICLSRLRWLGHLWRMEDHRLPKMILFGELTSGKRPQHKPKLRWRDCVSNDLQSFLIQPDWHVVALSRDRWRKVLNEGAKTIDESLNNKYKSRKACQKGLSSPSKSKCNLCNKYFTSDQYLHSHFTQKHGSNSLSASSSLVIQKCFSCPIRGCTFTSDSEKGVKIHSCRIHKGATMSGEHIPPINTAVSASCQIPGCPFSSNSIKGIKIHLRKYHNWSKSDVNTKLNT